MDLTVSYGITDPQHSRIYIVLECPETCSWFEDMLGHKTIVHKLTDFILSNSSTTMTGAEPCEMSVLIAVTEEGRNVFLRQSGCVESGSVSSF